MDKIGRLTTLQERRVQKISNCGLIFEALKRSADVTKFSCLGASMPVFKVLLPFQSAQLSLDHISAVWPPFS